MNNNEHLDVVIKLADNSDASTIAGLLVSAFEEYKQLYTKRAFSVTTLGPYKIKERIYNQVIWVAVVDGVVCGTISLIPEGNTLFIKSVAVAPFARKRGVGKQLMEHAEAMALNLGLGFLELTTTPFLHEAIKLYERFGFIACGHKDLYGTPLIRMVKNLSPAHLSSNKNVYVFN